MKYEMKTELVAAWISSRCSASLLRFASARSRTSAVMLFIATGGLSRQE